MSRVAKLTWTKNHCTIRRLHCALARPKTEDGPGAPRLAERAAPEPPGAETQSLPIHAQITGPEKQPESPTRRLPHEGRPAAERAEDAGRMGAEPALRAHPAGPRGRSQLRLA